MISYFLQLQQVMDAFIIFASQQAETNSTSQIIELTSAQSFGTASSLKLPLMQFSPSSIRIAPFPTREYTDDEFQSIIKNVMGVLYVLLFIAPFGFVLYLSEINNSSFDFITNYIFGDLQLGWADIFWDFSIQFLA